MASAKLAGILTGIFLLLFLSQAACLVQPADESSAVAVVVPSEAQDDANPTIVEVPSVEKEESDEKETIPELVEGSDHVDLSLIRPFRGRGRHHHCRHSHRRGRRFHGGEVAIPYGNDMFPMPKDSGLASGVRKDEAIAGEEVALPEEEEERRWWMKRREHKRKKAEEESDSDSDSGSDDEDEGAMEMARKKHRRWRKKKERKEKGGWLKWFMNLWD